MAKRIIRSNMSFPRSVFVLGAALALLGLHNVTSRCNVFRASTISPTLAGSHNATLFAGSGSTTTATQASGATPGYLLLTAGSAGSITGSTSKAKVGTFSFTPNAAGTYMVLFWSDDLTAGNTNGTFHAAERSLSVTLVAGRAPTAVKIKSVASSVAGLAVGSSTFSNNEGAGYIITLTDALGNPTIPAVGEAPSVSASNGTVSDASLTTSDFNTAGQAFVQVYGGVS